MTVINGAVPEGAALCICASNPDLRILQRVSKLEGFPLSKPVGPIRRVAIVDTETTGTDPMRDEIIDVAVVVVEVDSAGEIVRIASKGEALRDPGFPIPEAITRLTGITDEDVAGQGVDLDILERRLKGVELCIAHNARSDLGFLSHLMPGLADSAWACSASEIAWGQEGFDGAKLGHLLMQIGRFNEAHRAMADVVSLIHLLAHRFEDGRTAMSRLLDAASRPTIRLDALGAPFSSRHVLKDRGYRFDRQAKVWWIEVAESDCEEEEYWLRQNVCLYGTPPRRTPMTCQQRHR